MAKKTTTKRARPGRRKTTTKSSKAAGARKRTPKSRSGAGGTRARRPKLSKRRSKQSTPQRRAGRAGKLKRANVTLAAAVAAPPQSLIDAVDRVLVKVNPFGLQQLTPCMTLGQRLGLSTTIKRALSKSFRTIARAFNPNASISDDECAALGLVEDARGLVAAKAGFLFVKACK